MKDEREQMVYEIKHRYGLTSPAVLSAMLQIPREKFIAKKFRNIAYHDGPITIGHGQTMSQPYTVAFMTHLVISNKLKVTSNKKLDRVLEIGTGSGYQAAVLSKLFKEVYTIEIVPELAKRARTVLVRMGYKNVHVRAGSGEWGWKEKELLPAQAGFDAIIVTAAIEEKIPEGLFEQLKVGGVLVAPIGKGSDKIMTRYTKTRLHQGFGEAKKEEFGIFHFVPFVEEGN